MINASLLQGCRICSNTSVRGGDWFGEGGTVVKEPASARGSDFIVILAGGGEKLNFNPLLETMILCCTLNTVGAASQ